jgi:hypothetical protein
MKKTEQRAYDRRNNRALKGIIQHKKEDNDVSFKSGITTVLEIIINRKIENLLKEDMNNNKSARSEQ